jgi:hypothetical protein
MTLLRPRHILFLALSATVIWAGIRFYALGILTPGKPSVPSSPPTASAPSPVPVSGVYGPVPLSAPRSFPPAEEDSRHVAAIEKGDPELFQRNVEDALARVVQEKLPEAGLSDREIAQLAQTIRTLRESIAGLQELERTPENAAAIEALAGRIQQESGRIEEATGMSAAAFLNRITTEGIDNEKPEKGDVVLEHLDSPDR